MPPTRTSTRHGFRSRRSLVVLPLPVRTADVPPLNLTGMLGHPIGPCVG